MTFHGFGMYGMGGGFTDASEAGFSQKVASLGVNIHASPYRDYQVNDIVGLIHSLPASDGLFVWGTSLGSNNVPVLCNRLNRNVDGAFGFQASSYGSRGYLLNKNILFAHLIYSYNPIPFPGLGSYVWPLGTMNAESYHKTEHNIPHPGDYDEHDQEMFLHEMRNIINARR